MDKAKGRECAWRFYLRGKEERKDKKEGADVFAGTEVNEMSLNGAQKCWEGAAAWGRVGDELSMCAFPSLDFKPRGEIVQHFKNFKMTWLLEGKCSGEGTSGFWGIMPG